MALEFRKNPSLRELTTLELGGTAELEVTVRQEGDLDELAEFILSEQLRPLVIGWGSNMLFSDGHHDLALIRMEGAAAPDRVEHEGETLIFRAGAGMRLPGVLGWAQKAGLTGMENLAGIPGSVGGAVAMNAGSYGTEIKDIVRRVRLWTPAQGLFWKDVDQCSWGYRHFDPAIGFPKCLIWEVEMALRESDPKTVKKNTLNTYEKKKGTQPVTAKSAGCVFKNPEGESAGRLLDRAGFRGRGVGNMAFSEMHANFLVNLGGGASAEALELIDQARKAVNEQFGINLETEVICI
ncbi:UDP-N-acetylmuramate dehydrogenase [Salidesulfovibrio onnuriiensis]|uniref:UDP-N-acetylmuramate dehydrogenase n=1 Tax=Salidesulfovibrio onnuriiensis TaxID=2583823 RepID=UPI0011CC0CE5|nr:UDP-N-acetylmuramate dehydrogenase [Salidesulfovibrio onnuriiensis]